MVTDDYKISEILDHLDPESCDYDEWLAVGMACHDAGESCSLWDAWSRRDPARYHENECQKKWEGFTNKSRKVTVGTIVDLAMSRGWKPKSRENGVLGWDSEIGPRGAVDSAWVLPETIPGPTEPWSPGNEIIRYIDLLFHDEEYVGICTETYDFEGVHKPTQGSYHKTAIELKNALKKYKDDIGAVIGDYREDTGAWVRFNPLDGHGVKDGNVTDFRYALIESDAMDLEKQYALIMELQLPVKVLVFSGGKSLHAIVHVDAMDFDEYRKRVNEMYKICEDSGMILDKSNRNPSRLSRLPGVIRKGKKQYIVASDIGQPSWDAWKEYIDGLHDDLPEITHLDSVIANLPPLAPELIEGILREGHKLLISGASKAGKSFLLIELCVAIADGSTWLGRKCKKGRVMYINLELDPASCLHRFADVIKATATDLSVSKNLDIWNLRGRSEPLDQLAPKLIRRAMKGGYAAIIVDPIYKVITGDENAAEQMAKFCNQFDKIADQLKCAVIYCHHHSKGAQGAKRAADRASGSGVFARDPDAILDMIELTIPDGIRSEQIQKNQKIVLCEALDSARPGWREEMGEYIDSSLMVKLKAKELLNPDVFSFVDARCNTIEREWNACTGWRIESTLREFEPVRPILCMYKYPRHVLDENNVLKGLSAEGEKKSIKAARAEKQEAADGNSIQEAFETALSMVNMGEPATVADVAKYMNRSERNIRRYLEDFGYDTDRNNGNVIVRKEQLK